MTIYNNQAAVLPEGGSVELDISGMLWMVAITLLWGMNAITVKVLTLGMAPIMGAGLRGCIALVPLTFYSTLRGESFRYKGSLVLHGSVAGCIFALEGIFLYHGSRYTNGGHISIFFNLAPFLVAGGAHYLLPGERLHAIRVVGLSLAFVGVVLLFFDQIYIGNSGFWRGDLLVIGAAAMWASSTLYIKGILGERLGVLRLMWIRILVSTPILLAASFISEPNPFFAVTGLTIAALAFQGIVVVFFSYTMWVWLLSRYPAGRLQSFTFLTPVWGVLLGVILLDENVSVPMLVGIGFVAGGLYLVNRMVSRHP